MTAYKGLLKEKEALETSLAILTSKKSQDSSASTTTGTPTSESETSDATAQQANEPIIGGLSHATIGGDAESELRSQIATVMNSLATLSAEKSKMEASFQADKKAMRNELKLKDRSIGELQEKLSAANKETRLEVEKVKSRLIIERHEWEKESNNQMSMVRELQKLLADERQLKENIEMQLNDLKAHFSKSNDDDGKLSELTAELEQTRKRLKGVVSSQNSEKNAMAAESVLRQLQTEIVNLKRQHATALQSEQQRAHRAEERSKSLAAMHEERVANLENRLAELSTTVGSYDRLRQIDQENIAKLKERISQLGNHSVSDGGFDDGTESTASQTPVASRKYTDWTVNDLINEILLLKNVLLLENAKSETPVDISKIYGTFNAKSDETSCDCNQRYESLVAENEKYTNEIKRLTESLDTQTGHIKTLQAKIEILNRNIDAQETELRNKNHEHKNDLRLERTKWNEQIGNMETDFRAKLSELELQLQKQRERSLGLLEEKENEIKTLKTSFDVFMAPTSNKMTVGRPNDPNDQSIDERSNRRKKLSSTSSSHFSAIHGDSDEELTMMSTSVASSGPQSAKEPMHMLHYVHELSRKEVEITALRKAKHLAEQTLRQALQDKAASQEDLYDKISTLEEQVDRLERCKSREGANLEYLKNVILSFLATEDADGRRHMVNAIGAVLQFSPSELKTINSYFKEKKWCFLSPTFSFHSSIRW